MGDTSGGIKTEAPSEPEEPVSNPPKYEASSDGNSDSEIKADEYAKKIKFNDDESIGGNDAGHDSEPAESDVLGDEFQFNDDKDDDDYEEGNSKTDGDSDDESIDGNDAGYDSELAESGVPGDELQANHHEVNDDDHNDGSGNDNDESDSKGRPKKPCPCSPVSFHIITKCPEQLRQCKLCERAGEKHTDLELRRHNQRHHPKVHIRVSRRMGLCEELEILKCGFNIHSDWSGLADKFPGRDPETIRHIYNGMKPTGNYCFTIEAQKGSSNELNRIYRGLLTCCHPANRLIAELWMSYLGCQSDSQRTWWPKGVRYIKDKDSSLTQNELVTLLPHMLGMVTRQDSIAQKAGLTLPKLKALTLKDIQGTGPFPAPISAALHPALDLVFQLAEWEINSEAQASVAFSETLRVQCGRHSRFRRQLQKCFRSSGKFEQYKANPQHPLQGSLNVWMKQNLDGRSESHVVQFIEKMRAHFKAAYDNDEDSTVTSSIHIKDEQDCEEFILSKFGLCQRWLLSCLASIWIRVLKPEIRNFGEAPNWWIDGTTSRPKERLSQFVVGVFLLVLKQDPIADAVQLSLDALVDSAFLVFTTKGVNQTILLRLEAVYQVAKRVDGLWGQAERADEMVQEVRVKILDHVAIIDDADDVDDADDADRGKIVDLELVTVAFNIAPRRDRNSIARTFMAALFNLHSMPISYQGKKPFFWPEGLTLSAHWYSNSVGLHLGVARSIEEHARLNKLKALEEQVGVKLAKLAPPAKSAFEKIFVRAKERAAEIARSKTQRQDRIASTPLPVASPSASLIRSDTAQRERASHRRDGSPQPKRRRRASDDEGYETFRRSKRSTIRHAMQQDKPPAWAEQIITCFSILEDRIGRIQSQTDDIKAQNRRNQQIRPADNPRPSPPQDSGTAKQDDNAAAQVISTHQRRDAEDQAPADANGDNSATSIEATGDPSSDASDEDTPMQEAEDSPNATHLPGPTRHVADSRPDPLGEQEHESEGHDPDALMTGVEQPTCGQQDLPEATAITPPQAHEGEGGLELVVANAQPAEFPSPEDSTGRLASISTPDGDTATPLPITNSASRDASSHCEDTANTQTSTPSPSSSTTPQDRTTQPPATPNPSSQDGDGQLKVQDKSHGTTPQGSDTTEDTSRPTTPDTPLTSPDAPATDSPTKFTISAADMGEGLVQVLDKFMSDPSFANQVSVPLPGIDPTEIQKGLDVDYTHCQHTGVRFEAGPEAEGYANIFVSEDRHRLDWSKFRPGPVQEPTVEEAEEILDRFINNPPDHTIPYIIGHLKHSPFSKALNPGPTILGDPGLKDLHHEYHHIGLDGSANRFHQEDGTWEDESDGSHGLCSYNEVYYGFKLWVIVQVHHISKFRDWAQATWNCANCSQGLSHQCLLIAPATLKRAGIDFRIVVSKPGEAVVTQPGQQHEIVNYGPCAARSMNFTRSGEKIQFQKVVTGEQKEEKHENV
ncbi:hypothetical protein CDV31_016673 [Fusarium ambrosium]|uniref:JmjC domain-containing protein n=1 Tax=Fusarium ambrosium TaxID=131363 RepID=A0A428S573_9HYPO|nr:hypothetical protein CDV31_016673 [Fusarium ambrosium]